MKLSFTSILLIVLTLIFFIIGYVQKSSFIILLALILALLSLIWFWGELVKEKKTKKNNWTYAPNLIFGRFVGKCCYRHDKDYYDISRKITRKESDIALRKCITRETNFILGWIYYIFVRFSGARFYKER